MERLMEEAPCASPSMCSTPSTISSSSCSSSPYQGASSREVRKGSVNASEGAWQRSERENEDLIRTSSSSTSSSSSSLETLSADTAWNSSMKSRSYTRPSSPLTSLNQAMMAMGMGVGCGSPPPPAPQQQAPRRRDKYDLWTGNLVLSESQNKSKNRFDDPEKCGDKRDFFFRHVSYETRCKLQIDDVAAFSVTEVNTANKISQFLADLAYPERSSSTEKCPWTITDGTACIGGNVLSFADHFSSVIAVENNATRFGMLENNLRVLQKESNVQCILGNYVARMTELTQQIVFLDPPWGGVCYKDQAVVPLFLDGVSIDEICERLRHNTHIVALKVPTNFDVDAFEAHVTGRISVHDDFRKMRLIVVDYRHSVGG